MILKSTISLCPVCLADIPATICEENGAVIMHKTCPDHGEFSAMVERDVEFYRFVESHDSGGIYDGLLVDVTYKCNLRCKWCFQDLTRSDPTMAEIMDKVSAVPAMTPIILSGGEPTLNKNLAGIVYAISQHHPVTILTNGYKIDWSLPAEWVISYHAEGRKAFADAIKFARNNGKIFNSIIFTVDSERDLIDAVDLITHFKDIAINCRIHFASPVGADDGKDCNKMFISDMMKAIKNRYPQMLVGPSGKLQYYPIAIDGVVIFLIAWADKFSIDLKDLNCPPFYHDKNGNSRHLVEALIHNAH